MSDTKVVTGKVRFSYVNVFKATAMSEGQDPKYSVQLIISKDDKKTVNRVKKAIEAAYQAGKATYGGKLPKPWKNPLRDGDEERPDDEVYENTYFINANSKQKPGVVDANLQQIIDPGELYSGCYGRASINFYAFNVNGNKGVACGLNNVQKLADGERLGGGASDPEDDFGDDYDDSDDLM